MKKLLIATGMVSALVMTGCASNGTKDVNVIKAPQGDIHTKHEHRSEKHSKKPKHPHGEIIETYTCDSNATITAKYNPKTENALLNITAPSLSLNGAEVETKHVPAASGMLFVNDVNPASKYEWHAKGNFAMLDVTTADGKTHTVRCESARPMHDHAR